MNHQLKTITPGASYLIDIQAGLKNNVLDEKALNYVMRRFLWYLRNYPRPVKSVLNIPAPWTRLTLDAEKVLACLENTILPIDILRKFFIKFLNVMSEEIIKLLQQEIKRYSPKKSFSYTICLPLRVGYLHTMLEVVKYLTALAKIIEAEYIVDQKNYQTRQIVVLKYSGSLAPEGPINFLSDLTLLPPPVVPPKAPASNGSEIYRGRPRGRNSEANEGLGGSGSESINSGPAKPLAGEPAKPNTDNVSDPEEEAPASPEDEKSSEPEDEAPKPEEEPPKPEDIKTEDAKNPSADKPVETKGSSAMNFLPGPTPSDNQYYKVIKEGRQKDEFPLVPLQPAQKVYPPDNVLPLCPSSKGSGSECGFLLSECMSNTDTSPCSPCDFIVPLQSDCMTSSGSLCDFTGPQQSDCMTSSGSLCISDIFCSKKKGKSDSCDDINSCLLG